MNIKQKLLLAVGMAALALTAVPGIAAANPHLDYTEPHFTVSGDGGVLRGGANVTCTSMSGTGEFENGKTGTIQFTFHGCKSSGTNCTTTGQSTGTITTTTLPFHLVTVEHETGTTPAVLITPNNGHYATFKCAFGLVTAVVSGNGVIGKLTAPGFNEESNTFTVDFNAVEGTTTQEFTTIVGSETEYSLESSINGGAPSKASEEAEGTGIFTDDGVGILTETQE